MRDRSSGINRAANQDSKGCRKRNEKRYCVEWGRLIRAAKLLWPDRAKELNALLTEAHRSNRAIYSEERYLIIWHTFGSANAD